MREGGSISLFLNLDRIGLDWIGVVHCLYMHVGYGRAAGSFSLLLPLLGGLSVYTSPVPVPVLYLHLTP